MSTQFETALQAKHVPKEQVGLTLTVGVATTKVGQHEVQVLYNAARPTSWLIRFHDGSETHFSLDAAIGAMIDRKVTDNPSLFL
jgi:hypothetical protein